MRSFSWQTVGFIGMLLLRKNFGIDHLELPSLLCLYLALTVILMLLSDKQAIEYLKDSFKGHKYLSLVVVHVAIFFTYYLLRPDPSILAQYKNVHFAYFSPIYIMTKNFDILFQQLAFYMYCSDLLKKGISLRTIQVTSMVLLSASHTLTLLSLPTTIAYVFIIASGLAGLVFPLLITRLGFFFTASVHWLYYLLIGVLFNFTVASL